MRWVTLAKGQESRRLGGRALSMSHPYFFIPIIIKDASEQSVGAPPLYRLITTRYNTTTNTRVYYSKRDQREVSFSLNFSSSLLRCAVRVLLV